MSETLGENDPGMTLQEFIAYQYFFNQLDVVHAQVSMYKFLDKEKFTDIFNQFAAKHPYCVREKKGIDVVRIANVLFEFLDEDESGELEPEEIDLFMPVLMSEPKDEKIKAEAKAHFAEMVAGAKGWYNKILGKV